MIGARDRAQLLGSLAAEQITLPAEIRSALDDVSADTIETSDPAIVAGDRSTSGRAAGAGRVRACLTCSPSSAPPACGRGSGQAMAARLAEAGISSPADVTAPKLAGLPRMTDRRASRLVTSFIGAGQLYQIAELLVPEEIPVRWAARLADALGVDAAAVLRADPWRLLALPDAAVAQADRLARSIEPDVRRDDPRRGPRAGANGPSPGTPGTATPRRRSAWSPTGYGRSASTRNPRSVPRWSPAGWCGSPTRAVPTNRGSPERRWPTPSPAIAEGLARLVRTASTMAGERAVKGAVTGLDDVQAGAVALAAAHGVSLLTGGPGTGKSRTVAAIVALCRKVGRVDRAGGADRPGRETAGGTGRQQRHHRAPAARCPAAGRRVRPDRSSTMTPATRSRPIWWWWTRRRCWTPSWRAALISALSDGTHLVIVGDPAQLPSIGPGRVLGDLIDSGTVPVTELKSCTGRPRAARSPGWRSRCGPATWCAVDDPTHEVVVVPARGSEEAARRVVQLVTDSIPRVFECEGDQVQVVTPVHRGPAGTQALNRALKAVLNPGTGTVRGFDAG